MSIIQNVLTPFDIHESSAYEAMDIQAKVLLHWNDKIQSVTLKSLSHIVAPLLLKIDLY